ncbi:MAG: sodium/glutamate symporter [Pseudomonadota bacterium]
MPPINISNRETFIFAILVLFAGKLLTRRVNYLRRNNIPEPVTGGVLAALVAWLLWAIFDLEFRFQMDTRDLLLVVFFTTIGLSSRLETLRRGGRYLAIMLALAVGYLFIQNFVGIGVAVAMGYPSQAGVMVGSIALSGGHGTAIAWAPVLRDQADLQLALEVGLSTATFGLILGGLIGGPIAGWLIRRHDLRGEGVDGITVGFRHGEHERIEVDHMLITLLAIAVSMELGYQLHELMAVRGFNMPAFVPCLVVAIALTNTVPKLFPSLPWWPTDTRTLALVSDISLSLFLAMSLMSLKLWTMASVAGPLALVLICQLLAVLTFCVFVVYRFMGRDYEAAVIAAGYSGFAMGATPTAMANMTAVSKQYGAAPRAFLIIPLIGAFFIDVSNAFVIRTLLEWLA